MIYVYSSPSLDDQPRQSVDHSSLIVTVDPVSHREPRIVWSITSLSWSTRLSLCHDPAGHPRRDANMGVKFAIGHRYTGFWSVRYEFGNELRDEIGGTRGKTAREVVELVSFDRFRSFKNLEFRRVVIGKRSSRESSSKRVLFGKFFKTFGKARDLNKEKFLISKY